MHSRCMPFPILFVQHNLLSCIFTIWHLVTEYIAKFFKDMLGLDIALCFWRNAGADTTILYPLSPLFRIKVRPRLQA